MITLRTIALSLALLSFPVGALADPRSDSEQLYGVVTAHAPVLMDTFAAVKDPVETADLLERKVNDPVGVAEQEWIDAAFKRAPSSEPYRVFAPCAEASTALRSYSSKIQRFLRQIDDKPPTATDAALFRVKLGLCEDALGLARTFPGQIDGVR